MTIVKSSAVAMFLILLSSSVLLVNGCGRSEAKSEGCPSGSYVANATDSIIGPADGSFTVTSPFGNAYGGGIYILAPLVYTVQDSSGAPRNKVCVTFDTGGSYSNGVWYTDNTHSTVVTGAGALDSGVGVTDDNGRITLYWSTGVLPPANPVVVDTTISPVGYTAGTDPTGSTWIQTYSGTLSSLYTESWTVQGEQKPTL